MSNNKRMQEMILEKLKVIESEVKDIRQQDIPKIKTNIAVIETNAKLSARVTAGIISMITLSLSTAIAWFK